MRWMWWLSVAVAQDTGMDEEREPSPAWAALADEGDLVSVTGVVSLSEYLSQVGVQATVRPHRRIGLTVGLTDAGPMLSGRAYALPFLYGVLGYQALVDFNVTTTEGPTAGLGLEARRQRPLNLGAELAVGQAEDLFGSRQTVLIGNVYVGASFGTRNWGATDTDEDTGQ